MGLDGLKEEWPLQRLVHMLNHMQNKEKDEWKQSPLAHNSNEKDISPDDRDEVLAWIAKLTVQFCFHPETFFLASSILDRFITSVKAQPKYLKCIAVSCFYLASKICEEEDVIPCTSELVEESKCGCRVCDVLRMERIILEKLSWNLQSSTALDYLHILHSISFVHFTDLSSKLSISQHLGLLTCHLMNALCRYEVASFPNAVISLALLSLHLEAITRDPKKWTFVSRQLQSLMKVKTSDFMMCREVLKSSLPLKLPEHFQLLNKPNYLKSSTNDAGALPKELHCTSVAVKRKASLSPTTVNESTKKPHPDHYYACQEEAMECIGCESDETMTASEAEMEDESYPDECQPEPARPLTYAEIVKCGLDSPAFMAKNIDSVIGAPGAIAATSCGLQASCGFLSPTVTQRHGSVSGIPT